MRTTSDIGHVPSPNEVADRLAIADILAHHCRGVDRADAAILSACYWPEATVNYGAFAGSAHEFCERLPIGIRRFGLTQHTITNTIVRFTNKTMAKSETYVTAYHFGEDGNRQGTEMTYLGRYLDKFEKRRDNWKLIHRIVVMDWNQTIEITAKWDGPRFGSLRVRGTNDGTDPVYEFMGSLENPIS